MRAAADPDHFDLVVIGSGPAGEAGAIHAANFGKRVAVVERAPSVGGAGVNTGTLPSKTLRETALYLSGARTRGLYGVEQHLDADVSIDMFLHRLHDVVLTERSIVAERFERHNVELIHGTGRFVDERTVEVELPNGEMRRVTAAVFLLAPGSRPHRPAHVPFDGLRVHDSDSILSLPFVPKSLAVIGAGVIGSEYASIFATLGVRTILVDARPDLLPHVDEEIGHRLAAAFAGRLNIDMRFGHDVAGIELRADRVIVPLKNAAGVEADALLFAGGRQGNTDLLGLEKLGISVSSRGQIKVGDYFQTSVPHIYAAGDVVGFPALAATSMEQANVAMTHAFHLAYGEQRVDSVLPYGVYTVPEIGMVGETEQSCIQQGLDYEVGRALYASTARGQIVGDLEGMVKLVFEPASKRLLGAHIIGENATEIVHLAASVIHFGGTLDYFVEAVFNYPTLTDAYKDAAYDGLNRLAQRSFWQTTAALA